ncbi:MAG: caspase family protein [Saprospiraceae bacterium]|nr:caspase family protein [Candidatus Vicinibacter proximus]
MKMKFAIKNRLPNHGKIMSFYTKLGIFIFPFYIFSQQPVPSGKGATPISKIQINENQRKNTYAVVVGISDYQDKDIPDLRFADKDAEAFANYLRSNAGGNLDHDHLKLLVNEEATMAQFANALDWLWENVKEGNQAIIYFSGHGDVEKKSLTQPGFLLCWDAPARVYMAGGAFALPMLQEVISTLSIQNKAKVIVITDACRSGKLAGSSVGGAQATASNLSKQFANEIKILSCQPNEYSIEGEQWGGGRGAFSYNLVNALYGLADVNKDLSITLQEIGRYLEDHVAAEVAPVSQLPMVLGNRNEKVATVNPMILANVQSGRDHKTTMISPIEARGMEEDVLTLVDSSTRTVYNLFNKALKDKAFLEPVNQCAESYYALLISEPRLERLHSTLKRNYAAALQDGAQQWLNSFLKDPKFHGKRNLDLVRPFPIWLKRAAELLGEKHYMHAVLRARQYFFEGKILAPLSLGPNKSLGQKALEALNISLLWVPNQPHVFMRCGQIYQYMFLNADSAEYYFKKAAEFAPNWVLPYTQLATLNFGQKNKLNQAQRYLEYAEKLDSNSVDVCYWFAQYYIHIGDLKKAEATYKKCILLDVENPEFHNALGNIFLDANRLVEARQEFERAALMDSIDSEPVRQLGITLELMQDHDGAEKTFLRSIQIDSTDALSYFQLALLYTAKLRHLEAEKLYLKATQIDPSFSAAFYNIACLKATVGQTNLAFEYLEKAFAAGFIDFEFAQNDTDLMSLRSQTKRWNTLMKNYFPDQFKD